MDRDAVHKLLLQSAQTVLETMFFAMPDNASEDPRRPEGELIAASLAFQGVPPGRFVLVVSNQLAGILAANFMGCDDAALLPPPQVAGVMGELANMICGAVLSSIESDANFGLSTPECTSVAANEPGPGFADGSLFTCRCEFPEGAIVSILTFTEPA